MPEAEKFYGTALIKGKAILDFLLRCENAPTLAEITANTGASKPTTLKLLTTLSHLRLVRRDETTKRYYLGPQLIRYGEKAVQSFDVATVAKPHLEELLAKTGETVNLGIEADGHILLIAKLESSNSIKLRSVVGGTMQMYASAMGKAILAAYEPTTLAHYLKQHQLQKVTPQTLTTPAALIQDLETVRRTGISVDNEETEADVYCLGAVLRRGQQILGAFSVSAPKYRVNADRRKQFIKAIQETKRAIESEF